MDFSCFNLRQLSDRKILVSKNYTIWLLENLEKTITKKRRTGFSPMRR